MQRDAAGTPVPKILRTTPNFSTPLFLPSRDRLRPAAQRAHGSRQRTANTEKPRRTGVFSHSDTKEEPPGYPWKPQQQSGGRYPDGPCYDFSTGPAGKQEAGRANATLDRTKTALQTHKKDEKGVLITRRAVLGRYRPVRRAAAAHGNGAENGEKRSDKTDKIKKSCPIAGFMRVRGPQKRPKNGKSNRTKN